MTEVRANSVVSSYKSGVCAGRGVAMRLLNTFKLRHLTGRHIVAAGGVAMRLLNTFKLRPQTGGSLSISYRCNEVAQHL